jgi:hypothetical protein
VGFSKDSGGPDVHQLEPDVELAEPAPRAFRRRASLVGAHGGAPLEFSPMNIELTIVQEIEELMNVKGIGEKSFLKLKPLITVGDSKSATHQ